MTLRRSVAAIVLAPVLAALTLGCGTIINGRSQDVLVSSVPSGATAKVGDVQVVTPGMVEKYSSRMALFVSGSSVSRNIRSVSSRNPFLTPTATGGTGISMALTPLGGMRISYQGNGGNPQLEVQAIGQ